MKELLRDVLGARADLLEIPGGEHGDLALPCFSFAKELKKSPALIAGEIKAEVDKKISGGGVIEKVEIAGGYLNFYLNRVVVAKKMLSELGKGGLPLKGKSALVEHTSINPNSSPHIGRARGGIIGDCIARLLKYLGADVKTHYFVNDIGKQISLLVWAVGDTDGLDFNHMLDIYIKASDQMKNDPAVEKIVLEQLNKLESGDKGMQGLFYRVVEVCLTGISEIFGELGILHDHFDYESNFIVDGTVGKVLDKLKKTDKLSIDENGRYIVDLEGYGIHQKILPITRGDKTSLYPLRDICYTLFKIDKKPDLNIIVLGEDQKMYMQQINAVMDIMGHPPIKGVFNAHVLLAEGRMSTRSGNIVLLEGVMKTAVEKIGNKTLGYGAIKYALLKVAANKTVFFDWDAVLNTQGDSSIYLQYCYARIMSLVKKTTRKVDEIDYKIFQDENAWKILKKVHAFPGLLVNIVENNFVVSEIAGYLFNLAQLFSTWYGVSKIVDTDNIVLAKYVADVIRDGLGILGIDVLDEM